MKIEAKNWLHNVEPPFKDILQTLMTHHFSGSIPNQTRLMLQAQLKLNAKELALALLPIAETISIAPVSQFHVGAIVMDLDGNFYMGANLEIKNEALFHAVHAEQTAISHAWQAGAKGIQSIAITAVPCGHCRQFITELGLPPSAQIHVPNRPSYTIGDLMNDPFDSKDFKALTPEQSIFANQSQQLQLSCDDPLVQATVTEANLSYAPYSGTHAAVTLLTQSGQVFHGRYAENAAFNPSLLPMQCAFSALARAKINFDTIERVILVESSHGKISLRNASENALQAMCKANLEHYVATPSA